MIDHFIIGSWAVRDFFPSFNREPFDLDVVLAPSSDRKAIRALYASYPRVEFHDIPCLYDYVAEHGISPDVLLTLKASHLFWPIKWEKTMFDVNYLVDKGCTVVEGLFYQLIDLWSLRYGTGHRSNLDQPAVLFFDNALKTYDHDELHIILNPEPTYKLVLKDGADVDVDRLKFERLSYEQKCALVREEVYVMAFERRAKSRYQVAYYRMFNQFLMKHAPFWEGLFIIANYKQLFRAEFDYYELFERGLQNQSKE